MDFSSKKSLPYCTLGLHLRIVEQITIYTEKENEKWRYATKFIALFQEKHRQIPLIEYKFRYIL